jgi:hypothetical protein
MTIAFWSNKSLYKDLEIPNFSARKLNDFLGITISNPSRSRFFGRGFFRKVWKRKRFYALAYRQKKKGDKPFFLFMLVAQGGIEPPTQGFSVPCSTD